MRWPISVKKKESPSSKPSEKPFRGNLENWLLPVSKCRFDSGIPSLSPISALVYRSFSQIAKFYRTWMNRLFAYLWPLLIHYSIRLITSVHLFTLCRYRRGLRVHSRNCYDVSADGVCWRRRFTRRHSVLLQRRNEQQRHAPTFQNRGRSKSSPDHLILSAW